jgi:hypothetical protein
MPSRVALLATCLAALAGARAQSSKPDIPEDFIAESTWHSSSSNVTMHTTAYAKGDDLFLHMPDPLYFQSCHGELIFGKNDTGYAVDCAENEVHAHCFTQCLGGKCCEDDPHCSCHMVNYVMLFRQALKASGKPTGEACDDKKGHKWVADLDEQVDVAYCFSDAKKDTPVAISFGKKGQKERDVVIKFHSFSPVTPPSGLFKVPQDCKCSSGLAAHSTKGPSSMFLKK